LDFVIRGPAGGAIVALFLAQLPVGLADRLGHVAALGECGLSGCSAGHDARRKENGGTHECRRPNHESISLKLLRPN